jgi:DNA-binding NarL/FixJ family response regulator
MLAVAPAIPSAGGAIVRIVIAEDSALLREGLIQILGYFEHQVVAAVADAPALLQAVREHHPDVVVTDVRMPPGFRDEGLRAALELRERHPGLAVLVLSQYVEQSYAADLLQTGGGVGYLLKDRVGDVASSSTDWTGWHAAAASSIRKSSGSCCPDGGISRR